MKQILFSRGKIEVEEVPAPTVQSGCVLVAVEYSLISSGTETSSVKSSEKSLLKRAIENPQKVKQVWNIFIERGLKSTKETVKSKLKSSNPLGYSCAGKVIEVGEGVSDIQVGDCVACAGAGYANHAEVVCVPRNLVAKIPEGVNTKIAASTTLGAIAMQGVRRAEAQFGETIAVIGLGLIGQLIAQIARVAGCRIIGIDLIKTRVELAGKLGIECAVLASETDPVDAVWEYTEGYGADASIIAAATSSNEPVQQAMGMTRKKGKVVVVGAVGLNLQRQPFYEKEIDFLISCSYGPGRYDEDYEESGIDYPYGYVRWTENRNMQEYLRMLSEGKVNFDALISKEYDINDAPKAYQELQESDEKPLAVLLKYSLKSQTEQSEPERKVVNIQLRTLNLKNDKINVAVVGAGNFAQAVHLPNLKKLSELYNIHAIVTRTGANAKQVAERYKAVYCTTDYREVLEDESVNMVLIATRHNLHAPIAVDAAKAGKAIFSEKPMAINREQLDELVKVLKETKVPFMVGFNRRFSPCARKAKEIISKHRNPIIINYRVNAGYIPLDHWVHTEEGGGRIIGEACHMFDLFNYFTDSAVEKIDVNAVSPKTKNFSPNDNFTATLKYNDGSICTLTYTALGSKELNKEKIEIYFDGKVLIIHDFRNLEIYGSKVKGIESRKIEKGHLEELNEFAKCVRGESALPVPLEQLISATEISFAVDRLIIK